MSVVGQVTVDELSASPTAFWDRHKDSRTVMRLKVRTPKEPKKRDKVRKE
jgi:hypothetical protein